MYKQPKPILKPEALTGIFDAIIREFKIGRVSFPYKNCLNCIHWNEANEICNKFNSRPPVEIIVYSCEVHEDVKSGVDDDIPF